MFPKTNFFLPITEMKCKKNFSFDETRPGKQSNTPFFQFQNKLNKKNLKNFSSKCLLRLIQKLIINTTKSSRFLICPILIIKNTDFSVILIENRNVSKLVFKQTPGQPLFSILAEKNPNVCSPNLQFSLTDRLRRSAKVDCF